MNAGFLEIINHGQEEKIRLLQNKVDLYSANLEQYKQKSYNETQVRVDFVNFFFQLLGWDVLNENGLPQHLREVTHEANVTVEEDGESKNKKPDYACLVWFVYHCIAEKIRTYLGLLHSLGKIHFWINRVNIHLIHIASCLTATNMITTGFQLCRHLSCAPGRIVSMKMINNLFAGQFFLRHRSALVINACTVDIKQLGTNRSRYFLSRQKVLD